MDAYSEAAKRSEKQERSRKIKAVLASGVVLGIGAVATLAAWNDSEFADADFKAGTFDLQGSTDGTNYTDHVNASGAAELTFAANPNNLSPNVVVYAPFSIKLSSITDTKATVELSEEATGENAAHLTYSVHTVASHGATCSAASPPSGGAVVTSRAVNASGAAATFALESTDAVHYCFVITAASTLEQSKTATVTWEFAATSTTAMGS